MMLGPWLVACLSVFRVDSPPLPCPHFSLVRCPPVRWPESAILDFLSINRGQSGSASLPLFVDFTPAGKVLAVQLAGRDRLDEETRLALLNALQRGSFERSKKCTHSGPLDHSLQSVDLGNLSEPRLIKAPQGIFPSGVAECRELWVDGVWVIVVSFVVGKNGVPDQDGIQVHFPTRKPDQVNSRSKLTETVLEVFVGKAIANALFEAACQEGQGALYSRMYGIVGVRVEGGNPGFSEWRFSPRLPDLKSPTGFEIRSNEF